VANTKCNTCDRTGHKRGTSTENCTCSCHSASTRQGYKLETQLAIFLKDNGRRLQRRQRLFLERPSNSNRQLGRSSDFRIVLLTTPSRGIDGLHQISPPTNRLQWLLAVFVPGHSGETATDLHRFPYSFSQNSEPQRTPRSPAIIASPLEKSTKPDRETGKPCM